LYSVLVDPERGEFLEKNTRLLLNPNKQQMEEAIDWLFYNRVKDDLLLFYFAGHGVIDHYYDYYLTATDTRNRDVGGLQQSTAIDTASLHKSIKKSKSERKVVILDACFSGAIATGAMGNTVPLKLKESLGEKGTAILTSSSATQLSYEGVYTRYLVEGIATGAADLDGNGWISVDELHRYASEKVSEDSSNRMEMTPHFIPVEKEGHNIFIAKSRREDPKLRYEQIVQAYAQQNWWELPRLQLSMRQQELGISRVDASIIEERILQPYRNEYNERLEVYTQELTKAVQKQYPLSDSFQANLKAYQQHFKLRDEDIAEIDRRVLSQARPTQSNPAPAKIPTAPSPPVPQSPVIKTPIPAFTSAVRTPSKPIQPPVRRAVTKLSPNPTTRRNFIKWLGFGGVGAFSVLVLSQLGKKLSDTPNLPTASSPSVPGSAPKLTKIQFTSVKLNDKGVIIAKPAAIAQIYTEALGNGVALTMVKIPGGKFMMGSPESEKDRGKNESPQHQVTVPEFYLAQTLVTQAQYQAIMGNSDSYFKGNDKLPVEQVSWLDAVEFCEKLSQKTNRTYRLPSEAEWEYACRAGSKTPYAFGETINPAVVNYNGNFPYGGAAEGEYRAKTTPVGSFPPNLFGLYDMHGNLWEWCLDEYINNYNGAPTDGSARGNINSRDKNTNTVLRGGSWVNDAQNCRSAFRFYSAASDRSDLIGFRVVCQQSRTS
jgi:formylglycine-generating enzyme required for sulfatase activity